MDKSRSSSRSHFFGFKEVSEEQKRENINNVFSSVASEYDIMNDIMSLGVHRLWKRSMIKSIKSFTGKTLLDVAAGTGDISLQFVQNGGKKAIVSDINDNMLENAKHRSVCYNQEVKKRLEYMIANAESLPFEDNMFDYYTISFGIRNVTDIKTALREANRVLKPFGKFVCMEFNSHIDNKIVRKLYDLYSFNIIPKIGEIVTGDRGCIQIPVRKHQGLSKEKRICRNDRRIWIYKSKMSQPDMRNSQHIYRIQNLGSLSCSGNRSLRPM